MTASKKLGARAQQFVEEYLLDLNATQAAVRAGYSPRTAASQGERLLKDPRVAAAIQLAQAARLKRTRSRGDRVVQELERLAFVDIGDILDFAGEVPMLRAPNTIPEDARRAIQSIKVRRYIEKEGLTAREVELVEFKLHDKGSNLTTLMRHHGLLIDRMKVEDDVSEEELEQRVLGMLRTAMARKKAGVRPDPE